MDKDEILNGLATIYNLLEDCVDEEAQQARALAAEMVNKIKEDE